MSNRPGFDMNIPITWLLSGVLGFSVSMGGVYFQLNAAIESIKKIDTKMEVRDERITDLIRDYEKVAGSVNTHTILIKANEDRILDLTRRYENLEKGR